MQTGKLTLDNAALLAAIDQQQPTGIDVRTCTKAQGFYYDLKDLRHQLREQEDELLLSNSDPSVLPSWQSVITQSSTLLSKYSKDIEITVWLVEALVREHGYAGLNTGLQLLSQLVEQYQDSIYPLPDEEGNSTRLKAIAMLAGSQQSGTVSSVINLIPLCEVGECTVTIWEFYQLKNSTTEALTDNPFVKKLVLLTEGDKQLIEDTWQQSLSAIEKLDRILSAAYSHEAPSLIRLHESISEALKMYKHVMQRYCSQGKSTVQVEKKSIVTERQQAITAIKTAATYFKKHEPNSPIPLLLQRSLHWSNLNFQQIIEEIVAHEDIKKDFQRILGMPSQVMDKETDD